VLLFDRIALLAIAPVSEAWEVNGFLAHGLLIKALMALQSAHILGAMLRGMNQDGPVERMISG